MDFAKHTYYEDLARRQQEHLRQVEQSRHQTWQPCEHEQCSNCVGTGVGKDGMPCVHALTCQCPRCNPTARTAW